MDLQICGPPPVRQYRPRDKGRRARLATCTLMHTIAAGRHQTPYAAEPHLHLPPLDCCRRMPWLPLIPAFVFGRREDQRGLDAFAAAPGE